MLNSVEMGKFTNFQHLCTDFGQFTAVNSDNSVKNCKTPITGNLLTCKKCEPNILEFKNWLRHFYYFLYSGDGVAGF